MRWKILTHLCMTIAMINSSSGRELTIETNLLPENVATTPQRGTESSREYESELSNLTLFSNETDYSDQDHTTEGGHVTTKINSILEQQGSKSLEQSDLTDHLIMTESGPVAGFYLDEAKAIRSYIDIPYGKLLGLFKAPIKPSSWDEIHQVSEHKKKCPQIEESDEHYIGDTDCLTLSIFAPAAVENAPVLFHIHDGEYQRGSGDPAVYGPEHLLSKGIILVLPNYRLGALGFLCLRNEIVPGNAGLKDLALALEWTASNIAVFGGDSSNIAVSGDGTAGALAGLLALSPKSRPYIAKVITESGSVLAPWALDRDPITTAAQVAYAVRANITSDIELQTLVTAAKDFDIKPCVERDIQAFMDQTPWKLLHDEANSDIVYMIGTASNAGLSEALSPSNDTLKDLIGDFSNTLPDDLQFTEQAEKESIGKAVKRQYFNDSFTTEDREMLSLYYTDALYLGPMLRYGRLLSAVGASVFLYEFSFVGELNHELNHLDSNMKVAARRDMTGYVFTQHGNMPQPDSDEQKMVALTTHLWASFLHHGHPAADNTIWNKLEVVSEAEEEWLSIDWTPSPQKGVHVDRLHIWSEIYDTHYIESIEINQALVPTPFLPTTFFVMLICFYVSNPGH